jgi:hypothetical protein
MRQEGSRWADPAASVRRAIPAFHVSKSLTGWRAKGDEDFEIYWLVYDSSDLRSFTNIDSISFPWAGSRTRGRLLSLWDFSLSESVF